MNNMKGFTLIELMIVISIIGILASMALPSYQDRVIRSQVQEALGVAEVAQKEIEEYYKRTGSFPKDNKAASLPAAEKFIGNYMTRLDINDGVISIELGNRINKFVDGEVLILRPAIVTGEPKVPVSWICGYASVPEGMNVIGANLSKILPRQLPVNCRY